MAIAWKTMYGTPEIKKHFFTLILLQICGLVFLAFFAVFLFRAVGKDADSRLFAIIGRLEEQYPGSVSVAAPVLTGLPDEGDISRGRTLMAPYGYPEAAVMEKSILSSQIPAFSFAVFVCFALFSLLRFLLFFHFQGKLYSRLLELSECILSVLNGKTEAVATYYAEGILDLLAMRFNQMVKKLERASELLSREKQFLRNIISDISHQLKAPMASLIMFNDLMMDDRKMDEKDRRDFLRFSQSQLNKMEWLVKSLLKMARLETGSIIFDKTDLDIREVLRLAMENLKPMREGRTLIYSDGGKSIPLIPGDGSWLTEAFFNILKNAYEHTDPEEGRVTVEVSETALFLRISIEDNGSGIREADLPRIFERFFKGGNSIGMESVGIGLPLSKSIIDAHGGDLRAESRLGQGSRFIITFPY